MVPLLRRSCCSCSCSCACASCCCPACWRGCPSTDAGGKWRHHRNREGEGDGEGVGNLGMCRPAVFATLLWKLQRHPRILEHLRYPSGPADPSPAIAGDLWILLGVERNGEHSQAPTAHRALAHDLSGFCYRTCGFCSGEVFNATRKPHAPTVLRACRLATVISPANARDFCRFGCLLLPAPVSQGPR